MQNTSQKASSKPDTPFGLGIPILRSNVSTMQGFSGFARVAYRGQLSKMTNSALETNSQSRYIAITNAIKSVRRRCLVPNAARTSMSIIIAPMAMIEVLSDGKTAASTNTNSDSDTADAYYALVENEEDELLYTYQELGWTNIDTCIEQEGIAEIRRRAVQERVSKNLREFHRRRITSQKLTTQQSRADSSLNRFVSKYNINSGGGGSSSSTAASPQFINQHQFEAGSPLEEQAIRISQRCAEIDKQLEVKERSITTIIELQMEQKRGGNISTLGGIDVGLK